MANRLKKNDKVTKGAPSGFVISLIFHAAAFFVAGLFVVFTVLPKEEPEFKVPPPIERPKMKLKKPKVKIKKSSQPKPSSRIVAKVKTAKMPEIQIPDLVGTGEGLLGGLGTGGDFMDIPDISEVSLMGSTESDGSDLVGTYYDFKRNSSGGWIRNAFTRSEISEYLQLVNKFMKSGWNPASLSRYYRSPKKLYASCVFVPPTHSSVAPSAFDTQESPAGSWMVHYKGKLVHKNGITFRFVCSADFWLVIRVDGEIVYGASYRSPHYTEWNLDLMGGLYSPRTETRRYFINNEKAMAGEWITLEPGVAKDIDIILGDEAGWCSFAVCVEEKGVEYEKGPYGNPLLPIFRTKELSHDMVDRIYKDLAEGEVCVTNGPIFNDWAD